MEELFNQVDDNGIRYGIWRIDYTDCLMKEGLYEAGLREGIWTAYHMGSRVIWTAHFRRDEKNGVYKEFDKCGVVRWREYYLVVR